MSREGAGWRFWIVPHTHWDREWYLTVEDFQIRLAHTLDEVIDVLEREPAFRFALDGQAVVLEDYRAIHPERWGRLARLVAEGQMTVGPAYVLPDEFLAGQESLVRNLLLGRQACWELGVRPAELGYVPDMFGHVAQLPQILSGFGIDNAIFARGLGDEEDELGAAFRWRSPDGTGLVAIPQLGGYSGGHRLGHEVGVERASLARRAERALARLDRFVEEHGARLERSGLRDVLVCNGGDHEPIQRDLAAILRRVAEATPHRGLRIATYEDYVSALRTRVEELPEWQGELLGARSFPALRGVNSTRVYLKQANEECERELLAAESLAAMASIAGLCPYPRGELRLAWRGLLKNHPHDSICGCSVDEVHDEMGHRYTRVLRVARRVQQVVLAAIARREPDWRFAGPGPVTPAWMAASASPTRCRGSAGGWWSSHWRRSPARASWRSRTGRDAASPRSAPRPKACLRCCRSPGSRRHRFGPCARLVRSRGPAGWTGARSRTSTTACVPSAMARSA